MAISFDEFYGNILKARPGTPLEAIQTAYTQHTGEEPVFRSGPSREQWRKNLMANPATADMPEEEIDGAYEKLYGRSVLGEACKG